MAELVLERVSKRFGRTQAVLDLSLRVGDGELVVLLGPTGAGKTTTLRLAAGLERPDSGRVRIADHDVTATPPAARDVAFVFQQYSLYPHLSVYDNLAFPLRSPARRVPSCCASSRSSPAARPSSRAARCSGWQSAERWCDSPRCT
jgi:multiple sugar transport system ATP-binding protein